MKASVLTENLRKGISIALRGVANRVSLPVLSNTLVKAGKDGLVLSATDLELSFRVKVRAKVEEEGEIAVPAKLFSDLVATLPPGVMEMSLEKQTLKLMSEKVSAEVVGIFGEEFPALPKASGKGLTLPIEELRAKIDQVGIAAARDDARPILSGVLWKLDKEGITLAATDGYRLGVDTIKKEIAEGQGAGEKLVLPIRALLELARVLEPAMENVTVEFDKEKQQVIFSAGDVEMSSRLIAGEFPPYEKVIPATKSITVILERESLVEAVRRASLFARDAANVVRLLVSEGSVTVTAQSDQVGGSQSVLDAEVEGEEAKIAFNARYLLEYLAAIKEDRVKLETEGELKPAVFRLPTTAGRPEAGFLHVIMPVRTQN